MQRMKVWCFLRSRLSHVTTMWGTSSALVVIMSSSVRRRGSKVLLFYSASSSAWTGFSRERDKTCCSELTHLFQIHLIWSSDLFVSITVESDSVSLEKDTNTHLAESSRAAPSYWLIHHFSRETLWLPHVSLPLWARYSNVTSLEIKHWCLIRWEAERTGSCWYWSRHVHVLCERHHLKDVTQSVHMALQEKAPQHCAGCCLLSASRFQLPLFSLITVLLSSPQRCTIRVQQQQQLQRLNTVYHCLLSPEVKSASPFDFQCRAPTGIKNL